MPEADSALTCVDSQRAQPKNAWPSTSLQCPRCGYDLRGIVSTWEEACPLEGQCSECGLELEWGRLFADRAHPWLLESHWKSHPFRSSFLTIMNALCPWRLWSRVELWHRVNIWPILVIVPTFAFLVSAPVGFVREYLIQELIQYYNRSAYRNMAWWRRREPLLDLAREGLGDWIFDTHLWYSLAILMAWSALVSFSYLMLPATLARARIVPSHLARVAVYSMVWVLPGALIALSVGQTLNHWSKLARFATWLWRGSGLWTPEAAAVLYIATFGLLFVWWAYAGRRYLRIEQPLLVSFALNLIAILLVLIAVVAYCLISGNYRPIYMIR